MARTFNVFLAVISLLPSLAWSTANPSFPDESAERDYDPAYLSAATGTIDQRMTDTIYDWPVQVLSIGNTMASYQLYTTQLNDAYFHHGIDIRAEKGSPILASAGGKVLSITNYMDFDSYSYLYWEIAILDKNGFIWQYHHVDQSTIPQAIWDAQRSGVPIQARTQLGQVVEWPYSSFGEQYNHIHVNIIGAQKAYLNGFAFFKPLPVDSNPEIVDVQFLQNGQLVSGSRISGELFTLFRSARSHSKPTLLPSPLPYRLLHR